MSARAWQERRWWWLPLLILVLANAGALGWYGLVYSDYAKSVDRQLAARQAELESLQGQLQRHRRGMRRLGRNQRALDEFYESRLAPPSERLTSVIREVRSLAKTAGLQPSSISYPESELVEYGLVKRTFTFGVEGNYGQLRRLINLLEMTDSFLTLEEVTLSGQGGGAKLRIRLRLSTLFIEEPLPGDGDEAAS